MDENTSPMPGEAREPELPVDPSAVVFTERELAILDDRDPDQPQTIAESEAEASAEDVAVETPAEPAEVAETADSDDAAETPAPTGWITDADREYAARFGLDDYDLTDFASRAAFRKAMRVAEKAASRSQPKEAPAETDAADDEQYVDQPKLSDGRVNPAYYKQHDFDEATIAAVEALRETQDANLQIKQQIEWQQSQAQEADVQRQVNDFHRTLDTHRADFYGKSLDANGAPLKLTAEQQNRRIRLFEKAQLVSAHILDEQQRQGLPPSVPQWSQVVRDAEQLAFSKELEALRLTTQRQDLQAQSAQRRPAGTSAAAQARQSSTDDGDYTNHPDIVAAWNKAELAGV